jgi:glycosyltransferase involved in cell wall biosynthesis
MKICYLADASSIHTKRWVNYFAKKGHTVYLISYRMGEGYASNVRVHLLTRLAPQIWRISKYLNALLWFFQVRHLVKRLQPEIVDAHFITINACLGVASGFHPLVLTAWGSDILIVPKRTVLFRLLTKYILKKADGLICASPAIAEEEIKLGAQPEKIMRRDFGSVDINQFNPEKRVKELKEKLGAANAPVVISTRSLSTIYSVDTLIKATPLVLKEVPQAKFVIIGDGPQRNYLEKLAGNLETSSSIKFLGWLSHDELPVYLASADIYVSTSLSDGTSVSLLEAMACGLAPVITNIPANLRWVTDGENGFVVPRNDASALAERVVYLLGNDEVRKRFGKANREIIRNRAQHVREMEEIGEIYQTLINKRQREVKNLYADGAATLK